MRRPRYRVWLTGGILGLVLATSAGARPVWRVAPDGNDASPEGPFATLERALAASRAVSAGTAREIIVAPGRYVLKTPLILTERDSALTLRAETPGAARLVGGRRLTDWEPDGEGLYAASVPGVREGQWDFRALLVDGRYTPRARLPETGTFTHESRFDVRWMSTTGGGWQRKPTPEELTTLRFRPEDLPAGTEAANAEVRVYHMWDDSLVGVAHIDRAQGLLTFRSACSHPPGAFGVRQYVVFNTRAGLTRPGRWYLDRVRERVVLRPVPGQDPQRLTVWAPTLTSLIVVRGSGDRPVRDVTIRGLHLSCTTTPLEAGGFGAGRFAGAIEVTGVRHLALEDLEVTGAGGQGINVHGGGATIRGCHVHHVGACGIRAGGCTVDDNRVHHVGLTYPSAIGIVGGAGTTLTHNTVHDTPYTAINCGGADCRIEANHIYRAMTVLHDGGGIYCFAARNTVLRGNFIHDIPDTGGYGSSAYYLDERSEACVVEGNLSVGVARPAHNHMAHDNVLRGNVFLVEGAARLTFPKCADFRLEHNVIVAGGRLRIENAAALSLRDNAWFSGTGEIALRGAEGTRMLPAVGRDPALRDHRGGRVVFAPNSPAAAALGRERLDVSDAGCHRVPELPRVLIVGDSISLGYTPFVAAALRDEAVVVHNPGNARDTAYGRASLASWLELGDWDVIHVNWGLWDLRRDLGPFLPSRVPVTRYRENLRALVDRLEASGARLIWATTTPVPPGAAWRRRGEQAEYNRTAAALMADHGIRINDLCAAVGPRLDALQRPGNVHFTEAGYRALAEQVTAVIRAELSHLETPR